MDTEKFALDRRKIRKNLVRILKAPKEGRGYCLTCAELFLDSDYHKHVRHDILTKISMKHIRRPTLLLKASTQKEKEAQYFFSPKTIDYIVESLKELDFDRLILIGCPSIHEKVSASVLVGWQSTYFQGIFHSPYRSNAARKPWEWKVFS